MTGFDVWLWLKLDVISGLAIGVGLASLAIGGIVQLVIRIRMSEEANNPKYAAYAVPMLRKAWVWIAAGMLLLTLGVLCPSTKEYAVIRILPRVANSKFVSEELPSDAREMYDVFRSWAKEQMRAPEEAAPVKGGEYGQ